MLDQNTYELNRYMQIQDQNEVKWETNKDSNMQEVVDLTCKILKQEVDAKTFEWVFSKILNGDFDEELDVGYECDSLEALVEVLERFEYKDSVQLSKAMIVVCEAIDGACQLLFDDDFEDIFDTTHLHVFLSIANALEIHVI